ncbi:metallophosphoesterase [Acidithiobacillus albertensis]|uniref:metallophosphoesterase n=1 Tax=Acidithiobacillus albertensis TaxID=119978 RepID=UPI001C06A442|nr:metallophosphoesterase [Acidithiobacillus albertensis]MBU2741858.1 hypothetical protein [Acidithiobacillus albertensis]
MSIYGYYEKTLWDRANGFGGKDTKTASSTPFIQKKIVRHAANTQGRDFIVGDLHGCAGYLDTLLRYVGFDPSTDRLFSVGDLTDRGPDSPAVLDWLREPWFLPVLGNHDAMLMAVLMDQLETVSDVKEMSPVDRVRIEVYGGSFFSNGGKWLLPFLQGSAHLDTLAGWLDLLRGMPLIRVVGADSPSRFHVAHAELLGGDADWCDQTLDQSDAEENPLWESPHNIWGFDMTGDGLDHVLWGRELRARVAENGMTDQPGLSRTYVGHTITVMRDPSRLLTVGSHVFLDTGSYKSVPNDKGVCDQNHGLTIWCHQEERSWKFNGEKVVDVRVANGQEDAE